MSTRSNWSRRQFLQHASVGAAIAVTAPSGLFAAADDFPVIDCHAHIYSLDEQTYPIIENPYRPPAGAGTVEHLRREMQAAGVKFATAIHTSTFYRWDNRFTADASRDNRDVLAGVCTLNPDDPASPATLENYVTNYNIRGMRSIPALSNKLDDPGVDALWGIAEKLGIVINVLVNADRQGEIEALVERHPKLRIVLDHCLNIKAGPTLEPTVAAMQALAALPTVHAKLSFMATGSAGEYPFTDMHAPCLAVIEAYGPERCVWGSDFPCELWTPKASYAQNLRLFTHELGLDRAAQRAILWETPHRLWFADRA
ncbi:MAG: amidohydrolase [Planctomycetaceae bacterium]|nr:amidohydrolase [Planctomycetaceae bacterium]